MKKKFDFCLQIRLTTTCIIHSSPPTFRKIPIIKQTMIYNGLFLVENPLQIIHKHVVAH